MCQSRQPTSTASETVLAVAKAEEKAISIERERDEKMNILGRAALQTLANASRANSSGVLPESEGGRLVGLVTWNVAGWRSTVEAIKTDWGSLQCFLGNLKCDVFAIQVCYAGWVSAYVLFFEVSARET